MPVNKHYTLKQIADIVGVSSSTVSRVLNKAYSRVKITEETIRKIHETVEKYDYVPNISARRLAQRRAYAIGLEVPAWNIGNHAFSDLTLVEALRGIEDEIIKTPYNLSILFKNAEYMKSGRHLRMLKENTIDGLLVWGSSYQDTYDRAMLQYPVIFINSRPSSDFSGNYIGHDNFGGSFKLTEYAIKQGSRRFLYFCGPPTSSIGEERLAGFQAALSRHGLTLPPENLVQAGYRRDDAMAAMVRILSEKQLHFDTVICANDRMAAGIYDAAVQYNLRIPEDFRLAGGDGIHEVYDAYKITSFGVDCFQMGATATQKLIALIEGRGKNFRNLILKPNYSSNKPCKNPNTV